MTGAGTGAGTAPWTRSFAAARLWATSHMPYLAAALFAAPVVVDEGSGTIAVDRRWQLRVDPELLDHLGVEEVGRLLLHLVGHLVRDHAGRATVAGVALLGTAERWNRASDAELNDDLEHFGLVPASAPDLPSTFGLAPRRLAEQYLGAVPSGRLWDCGSGCDGQPRPDEESLGDRPAAGEQRFGIDGRRAELLRLAVAAAVQQASGRQPGSVPGGWLRWAETVLPTRVDWRRLLAAEIRRELAAVAGAVDYTYRHPSRRATAAAPAVLPALLRPVPTVAIVCDTSGSMHEHLLARVLAEVDGILGRTGVRYGETRVLSVDTAVHGVQRVASARQVVLAGGGGTDMGAGVAAAALLRPRPSVVIVLTDGYTPWPLAKPKGMAVVVGILAQHAMDLPVNAPSWARTVVIDE